ncbi:MAG: hypothetical protein NXH82_11855 [Rhodobacteraceae bacterium]|nr:hypothetical protein [Paracoccaceae bacterium]
MNRTPMFVLATILAPLLAAGPALSDDKAQSCRYQADVVAAIQKARQDRVSERDVPDAIARTNPAWPENYNTAIPLITPWVYEQPRAIIRNEDLSAAWLELCLAQ